MTISTSTRVPSIEGISSDKDRINALYAPFRPREANPEHYDRKLKFWIKAVDEYSTTCNRISFSVKELQQEFKLDGRTPACLREVLTHVYRDGTLITEQDFQENMKAAESWKAWSQTSALRIVRKVGAYVPSPISYFYRSPEEEIRYIHMEHLKEHVSSILSDSTLQNKLLSISSWKSRVHELTKLSDPVDLDYILCYVKSRRHVVVDKVGSEEVVLMSAEGNQPKITQVEKGKYDITRTKEILETQLEEVTVKAQKAENGARTYLKEGRRNAAKHELRRKKLLEQRMEKLLTMVDNLTVLGMQIEDAESDAVMISAYEAGKKALAGVFEDKRMNVDHVTDAMLDIQELLDQHADVSAALQQPVDGQEADIADLENELEALLKEDEEKSKSQVSQPSPQPEPTKPTVLTDEEEAVKLLESLELDGLEDFSKNMGSQTKKLDRSGDV